jgi:hypothetical protein
MACIRKQILIDARPEDVWVAVRDWGALHERLVPDAVTQVQDHRAWRGVNGK